MCTLSVLSFLRYRFWNQLYLYLIYQANLKLFFYLFLQTSVRSHLSIQLMDDGNEKKEVVAVSMDPNFVAHLNNEFLPIPINKESDRIILQRYRCTNNVVTFWLDDLMVLLYRF